MQTLKLTYIYTPTKVISEGWAAPLEGFLREGPLMQVLHFNSLQTDTFNRTGAVDLSTRSTDWNDYTTRGPDRMPLSVPIILPATDYTKEQIESSGKKVGVRAFVCVHACERV